MKMLALIALLMGAPVAAAPAPLRWTPVGHDAGGRTVEIERGSLTWRPLQRAWWRIVHVEPRSDGAVEERHLELIDCSGRTSAVIQTLAIGPEGAVLSDQQDGESLAMQRLSPPTAGTTGEMVAIAACRMRPPPPRSRR